MTDYALRTPCADCPFRADKTFHLRPERAAEIARALRSNAGDFHCHKTVNYDDGLEGSIEQGKTKVCAGALITMEKSGLSTQNMRIAGRLGLYDPARLDMDAPVYDDLSAWLRAFAPETDNDTDYEHCDVAGRDCDDPAGYSMGGHTVTNDGGATVRSDHTCQHCGSLCCEACTASSETVTNGGDTMTVHTCIECAEDQPVKDAG